MITGLWSWAYGYDWKVKRGEYKEAAVIGAVIDLGNCLDLTHRDDVELVRTSHKYFMKHQKLSGLPIPKNVSVKGQPNRDRILRFLDCAVIMHLHAAILDNPDLLPFDSVRGMFSEGKPLYSGCGYKERSHVQIAVRNSSCIKGIFYPRGMNDE